MERGRNPQRGLPPRLLRKVNIVVSPEGAPPHAAQERALADLCAKLLDSLDGDVLPMAHLDALVAHSDIADTAADRRSLATDLIATLLKQGRLLVGDVVGGDPAYIQPWTGTHADIINSVRDRYVRDYENTHGWDLSIWLSLNDPERVWDNTESAVR